MAQTLKWSRLDKRRAQTILKDVADEIGGWQQLADKLGMTADSSRATVQAWHRRGRIPVAYVPSIHQFAVEAGIDCQPGYLSPQAKHLETAKQ